MKRTRVIIYSIASFIFAAIVSVVYIFYMQTLVSTRTKTNVGIHTSESAKFIDEYAKNSYELINDGIVSSTLSKEELLSSFVKDYEQYGIRGIGYYSSDFNFSYETLTTKKSGVLSSQFISRDKYLNQKVTLIKEKYILDNNDETSILFYCINRDSEKFFVIQDFSRIKDLMITPYGETKSYYIVASSDGMVIDTNYGGNSSLTMSSIFGNDDSIESFNEQFKDDTIAILDLVSESRYFVSEYEILDGQNDTTFYLYSLVRTSFIHDVTNIVLYTTIVFVSVFIGFFLVFFIYLFITYSISKRKYGKEGAIIKDDRHYSLLLDKKGKVISKNSRFSAFGLRTSGNFASIVEILELDGNIDSFGELLNVRPEFTAKITDFDGKVKNIKFLVIKNNFGYQLIGEDVEDSISIIPFEKNMVKEKMEKKTIEEVKYSNDEIEELYRDDLYDIYNKKALYLEIKKIIKEDGVNNPNTYLFYFGNTNEEEVLRTYGNAIEELLNGSIISAIQKQIGDIKIYNVDDHHFAFFYELTDTFQTLTKMMEKISEVMKKPAKVFSNEIETEVDFGIYHFKSFSLERTTPKKLIEKAALSFKQAKELTNKNYKIYDENLEVAYELEDIIADDIKKGLENNEFVTYFQPNYSLKDDRVSGFECLLRWNNEKYRYDSPFKYIQVAEKVGLINEIGFFTLVESFKLIKELNDPFLHISVNVSPAQFLQPGFISKLVNLYTEYEVPYSAICIEITETFLIQSMNEVIEKLKYLRSFGIKIYLDDFGTGYSSLLYLAELPVDVIKIDKAFITPLKTSKSSRTIVSELIQIANELDIDLVAEGVEDDYQVNFLEKKKCNNIQGYYFSKPVPIEEVRDALLIKRKENGRAK